ncbi:peptidase C65 Otubain-domain-containing protein [Lactarius quietus]|nr:peptidase C65 Otubain-domain-containing protein [Lactarius quietus]KAF8269587.1 peptidase C65 Otubain-domain-containing protein [Lactarius quietus]
MNDITADTDITSLSVAQLHELNQKHLDSSIPSQAPLMAELAPLSVLRAEYEGSDSFIKQIDSLSKKGYEGIRRSRGDGDCFYRSLAFAYIERIFNAGDKELAVGTSISTLESFLPRLEEVGFDRSVIDEAYEIPRDLIRGIVEPEPVSNSGQTLTPAQLLEVFQDDSLSNYMVMFLRMLTSAQIRGNPEEYEPFVMHPDLGEKMGVKEFCEAVVEVLGREADHVQVTAISEALKVNVEIAYLDGRNRDGNVEFVKFSRAIDEKEAPLTLIYRPGHYDILDRRSIEALGLNI